MNKVKVYIINGMACSGKDELAKFVNEEMVKQIEFFRKYSSVDWPKKVCEFCGWNGSKEDKDRKFIHDISSALETWDNSPLQTTLSNIIHEWKEYGYKYFFVDIRETYRIDKFKRMCKQFGFEVFTVFVTRPGIKQITSNQGDAYTLQSYNYDYYLKNDGSLEDWKNKAIKFVNEVMLEME